MLRINTCILICALCLASLAYAEGPSALNPKFDLKPGFEDEDTAIIAVASSHVLTPSAFAFVPYEKIIDANFATVMHRLESNIPATGFKVNTANSQTGIITCALKTNTPEKYIDMGQTTRTYDNEVFAYPTAAAAVYKLPYVNSNGHYYLARQTTSLNCLATLQLLNLGQNQTKVSVSINYIFSQETRYENTAFRKNAPPTENVSISFMTNIIQEFNLGSQTEPVFVTPQSNGVLEEALLDAIQLYE